MEKELKVIDLTHEIRTGMMVYPGDPGVEVNESLTHEAAFCHVDRLDMGTHTGTHIDAPYHFLADGKRITDFPAGTFVGEGVVIDLTEKKAGEAITGEDLMPARDRVRAGDLVLLQTGWCRYFGSEEYLDHPYLSGEAAELLVKWGARIVAVDFLNVDSTRLEQEDAHPALLSKDVLIVENIANSLALDPRKRYLFSFAPLKVAGSDGGPVRAFAIER